MAYTFGAATTDDLSGTGVVSIGGNSTTTWVAGWFYPTTLTAGRCYFGTGALNSIAVAPTTSELRLTHDRATTDSVFDTTGAGIVVNEWVFIAVLFQSGSAGADGTWTVWVGRSDSPPAIVTNSLTTTGLGNNSSTTAYCIGNQAAASSVAFQGDIGPFMYVAQQGLAIDRPVPVAAAGGQTAAEILYIWEKWVIPFWLGKPPIGDLTVLAVTATIIQFVDLDSVPASTTEVASHRVLCDTAEPATCSIEMMVVGGATYTANKAPRTYCSSYPLAASTPRR